MGKDFVYQVVSDTERGFETEMFETTEDLLKRYDIIGLNTNPRSREELQRQPKLKGLLGPMYNGTDENGNVVIRYESQRVYDILSS